METESVRTALAGTEEASFVSEAVNGLLYLVFVLPPAVFVAPYTGHPLVESLVAPLVEYPFDSVVLVLVVIGPPIAFGLANRGVVPALVFVFPATTVLFAVATNDPWALGANMPLDVWTPIRAPYFEVVLPLSIAVTLVCVTVGYAWGRGVALLSEEFAAE